MIRLHSPFLNGLNLSSLACTVVLLAVIAIGVTIVLVKHDIRVKHAGLQKLAQREQQLKIDKGKLLLEYSTWCHDSRLERIASQSMAMIYPQSPEIVVIQHD